MEFNRFIWELYAKSVRGKKALSRFSHLTSKWGDHPRTILWEFFPGSFQALYPKGVSFDIANLVREATSRLKFKDSKDAYRYFKKNLLKDGLPLRVADRGGRNCLIGSWPDEEEKDSLYDYVQPLSLGLHFSHPDLFLPYGFRRKFNLLEEIHSEFGIPLPSIPSKGDKAERTTYYLSINEVWQEFRQRHGLSPVEMCAFLYDFAPKFTTQLDTSDLPSPSKAWLITGGVWDFDFVDNAREQSQSTWAGNLGVRRGDILLMYLRSPRRSIGSVWRASSDSCIDPFFHYHSMVSICKPVNTTPVAFAELKEHPFLSQKSAIRANFQGPSSQTSFTVEEYEAILEIMKSKGQDISILPQLPSRHQTLPVEVQNERDVEVRLIEPFLKRLGFKENDWVRQMPVKMGRGERNYPDYAFGAKVKPGEENAKMVLEAKYQLSAHREFADSFYQTKSYALRLQCRIMVMAAKEGVWVFLPESGNFEMKRHVHKNWGELNHPDGFHRMLSLIGRDKVFCRRM